MPTSQKREAVQLRPEVHRIVCKTADEINLSKSKTISLLVEDALINRGLYKRQLANKDKADHQAYKSPEQHWFP